MIQPGEIAPDFTLSSDAHGDVTLSALRGKPVVLYFYPKDDTPACTQEACVRPCAHRPAGSSSSPAE